MIAATIILAIMALAVFAFSLWVFWLLIRESRAFDLALGICISAEILSGLIAGQALGSLIGG